MPTLCDKIDLFADGEMPPEEAEAFRDHLPTCQRCQVQLSNLVVLERLGARYVKKREEKQGSREQPPLPLRQPHRRPPRWHLAALGAAACAVVALVVLSSRSGPASVPEPSESAWNPQGRTRYSPRVSDPRADGYGPAGQVMGSGDSQGLPSKDLVLFEARKDERGQIAAYLAWDRPEEALKLLGKRTEKESPEDQNDRAAALMLLGQKLGSSPEAFSKYEEALDVLNSLLQKRPEDSKARWNRGLVLDKLHLTLLAMHDFEEVARKEQNEKWKKEAADWAAKLRNRSLGEEARWQRIRSIGEELAATGRFQEGSSELTSPIMRLYFYEAVRTRTSREEVLALMPLAKKLDEEVARSSQGPRSDVLQRYVERISRRNFSARAALARDYARLSNAAQKDPSDPQVAVILGRILRSSEGDLILGALHHAKADREHWKEYEASAKASKDPWFEIFALQKSAASLISKGNFWTAESQLKAALATCGEEPVTYRCMDVRLDLAHLYAQLLLPDEVVSHAREGLKIAWDHTLRGNEIQLLEMLATAARLRDDVPVARTYLSEVLKRLSEGREPEHRDPRQERYIHEQMALLELHVLNFDGARAHIDQAIATKEPLSLDGAAALSDIARQRSGPADEEAMNRVIAAAEKLEKGKHALATHHLGRFYLSIARVKGQGLLRDAIHAAEEAEEADEYSRHARTYSYTALIMDAAQARDFNAAAKLFGEELLGMAVPERCVLGLTVDSERSLILAWGADGKLRGYYEGAHTTLAQREKNLVPKEALAAITPCEKVEVLARPPLQGRSGILPSEVAWSFRTRPEVPQPPVGKAVHLVVMDVAYDPKKLEQLDLTQNLQWTAEFGEGEQPRELQGTRATPHQVLQEMEGATEIDLVTHGVVSPISDAAFLLLAREREVRGADELWAHQLREKKLKGAPLVILAACKAGRSAPVLHESVSLPNAFLKAGARAVLAATESPEDLEASRFFNAIRARIRQGATPAAALRDERMLWGKQQSKPEWIESVLLFE